MAEAQYELLQGMLVNVIASRFNKMHGITYETYHEQLGIKNSKSPKKSQSQENVTFGECLDTVLKDLKNWKKDFYEETFQIFKKRYPQAEGVFNKIWRYHFVQLYDTQPPGNPPTFEQYLKSVILSVAEQLVGKPELFEKNSSQPLKDIVRSTAADEFDKSIVYVVCNLSSEFITAPTPVPKKLIDKYEVMKGFVEEALLDKKTTNDDGDDDDVCESGFFEDKN